MDCVFTLLSYLGLYTAPEPALFDSILSYLRLYTAPEPALFDTILSFLRHYTAPEPALLDSIMSYIGPEMTYWDQMSTWISETFYMLVETDQSILFMMITAVYLLSLTFKFRAISGERNAVKRLVCCCIMVPLILCLFVTMMCAQLDWPEQYINCGIFVITLPGNTRVIWSLLKCVVFRPKSVRISENRVGFNQRRSAPAIYAKRSETCYGEGDVKSRPLPVVGQSPPIISVTGEGNLLRDNNPANIPTSAEPEPCSQAGAPDRVPQENIDNNNITVQPGSCGDAKTRYVVSANEICDMKENAMGVSPDQKRAKAVTPKWLALGRTSIQAAVPLMFACISMVSPKHAPAAVHLLVASYIIYPKMTKDNGYSMARGISDTILKGPSAVSQSLSSAARMVTSAGRMVSSMFAFAKMRKADINCFPVTKFNRETVSLTAA